MSRIHEALSQAGIKSPAADHPTGGSAAILETFPTTGEAPPAQPPRPPAQAVDVAPANVARNVNDHLIVHPDTDGFAVEQYRHIAAVLHHAQVQRNIRTVMVASARPAEGKTLTAANL